VGGRLEIGPPETQAAGEGAVLVQHDPRRDHGRPGQMIGQERGPAAMFIQKAHDQLSRIEMAREGQVAAKHVEEPLVGPGGVEADRMGDRPPEESQPPDPQRQSQHHGDGAHEDGVVPRHARQGHGLRQGAGDRQIPAGRTVIGQRVRHQLISAPPANPKNWRKKVEAAKAIDRPNRMPSPRRMDEPFSLMATPAPKSTTATTAAAWTTGPVMDSTIC
ncbi:hypothetical protein LTR94_023786, partial [Friedmanniomyces endolithicus]